MWSWRDGPCVRVLAITLLVVFAGCVQIVTETGEQPVPCVYLTPFDNVDPRPPGPANAPTQATACTRPSAQGLDRLRLSERVETGGDGVSLRLAPNATRFPDAFACVVYRGERGHHADECQVVRGARDAPEDGAAAYTVEAWTAGTQVTVYAFDRSGRVIAASEGDAALPGSS